MVNIQCFGDCMVSSNYHNYISLQLARAIHIFYQYFPHVNALYPKYGRFDDLNNLKEPQTPTTVNIQCLLNWHWIVQNLCKWLHYVITYPYFSSCKFCNFGPQFVTWLPTKCSLYSPLTDDMTNIIIWNCHKHLVYSITNLNIKWHTIAINSFYCRLNLSFRAPINFALQ